MKTQELEKEMPSPVLEYPGLSGIADEETAQQEAIDGAQAEAAAQEAAVEQEDNVEGWRTAVGYAASMIAAMIPEAEVVWNPKKCDALAEALAKCDEAYGWGGVGGLIGHPLVALGFASFPLVVGTAKAINQAKERSTVDVEAREVGADAMGAAAAGPATPAEA